MLTTINKFNLPDALVGEHSVRILPLQMGKPRDTISALLPEKALCRTYGRLCLPGGD